MRPITQMPTHQPNAPLLATNPAQVLPYQQNVALHFVGGI